MLVVGLLTLEQFSYFLCEIFPRCSMFSYFLKYFFHTSQGKIKVAAQKTSWVSNNLLQRTCFAWMCEWVKGCLRVLAVFLLPALHISNGSKNEENSNNTAGQKGKILSSFPTEAAATAVCKIYFYCYCGHTRSTLQHATHSYQQQDQQDDSFGWSTFCH